MVFRIHTNFIKIKNSRWLLTAGGGCKKPINFSQASNFSFDITKLIDFIK